MEEEKERTTRSKMWTDQEMQFLKANFRSMSNSQLALKLGRTRNEIAGKLWRMGLKKSDRPINRAAPKPKVKPVNKGSVGQNAYSGVRVAPKPVHPIRVSAPIIKKHRLTSSLELEPKHITFAELKRAVCRWPYGDGPFTFCGHTTYEEESYCPYHLSLSFRNTTPRSTP